MHSFSVKPTTDHKATEPTKKSPDSAARYNPAQITRSPAWAQMQPLQAKLRINQPGDLYEQEADRVADQVMRMLEPAIQREPG